MLDLKKTALAVLVSVSSSSFAGTMGPICQPGNVTVPCPSTAWDIGIQALYLKPSYSANTIYIGSLITGDRQLRNEFRPEWDWGFKLEGSYHFNTGNDLNVNWYHYSERTTRTFLLSSQTFLIDIPFTSSAKPEWDAVNFEFGQHVDFGDYKDIRFHGGFQYLRLEHDVKNFYSLNATTYRSNLEFKGFGPRVGMDMTYNFNDAFAIYANGAAALLVGDSDINHHSPTTGLHTSASKWTTVPELEAKTGAKYNHLLGTGVLTLDAGYMWVNYFNAQHALSDIPEETNVAFNGPYIGLKWLGNV
ncbi:major outer membrane protein [Legionella birminghamensis]|uniref:Major outer membrane protein n=1 Tax=Legionella birminghamensis TaxID=28083 RepID=A0A378IBV1_9GAMM|nr:Lpg1974 family pore-forming outer membrane protein [Legionella birminghamensis]KTC67787.1 major outer membrane protein [Legionella birminghamensis]STX32051.1 major outer membrane protein [Legionella birminghamensis]